MLVAVRRTFITPFDRTDIQDLITSMDDAIDQMNKTAKTIVTFEVRVFEPCMQQMSEIIVQSAKLVLEAVPLLSSIGTNAGRLNALTTKIINVEEEADQVYDRGLKALFVASRESNAMNFIVGSQVYDHLEKVVDRFEDVANEISSRSRHRNGELGGNAGGAARTSFCIRRLLHLRITAPRAISINGSRAAASSALPASTHAHSPPSSAKRACRMR